MNKELLLSYKSKKAEIYELKYSLQRMNEDDTLIDNDTILNYTKGYPVPQAVVGIDWNKAYKKEKRYLTRIETLEKECKEVEDFIESIQDSLVRRIFRMHYIDGISQNSIAKVIHMDRSNVGKKINTFLKLSHNSPNSHV